VIAEFVSNFSSPVPDAYALVNSLQVITSASPSFVSAARTAAFPNSHGPVWEENLQITIAGRGILVINVFSQGTFEALDSFLGQATLALDDFPEIYSGRTVSLELSLRDSTYSVRCSFFIN